MQFHVLLPALSYISGTEYSPAAVPPFEIVLTPPFWPHGGLEAALGVEAEAWSHGRVVSAVLPGASPCGRRAPRIKGWMGRADQATKVKGMFVQPAQVAAVVRRHGEIARARLVVARDGDGDAMTLLCEVAEDARGGGAAGLAAAIADSLQSACKLKGRVELVAPGSLANDGKVIDDQRSYD